MPRISGKDFVWGSIVVILLLPAPLVYKEYSRLDMHDKMLSEEVKTLRLDNGKLERRVEELSNALLALKGLRGSDDDKTRR